MDWLTLSDTLEHSKRLQEVAESPSAVSRKRNENIKRRPDEIWWMGSWAQVNGAQEIESKNRAALPLLVAEYQILLFLFLPTALGDLKKMVESQCHPFTQRSEPSRMGSRVSRMWGKGGDIGIQPWHEISQWWRWFMAVECVVLHRSGRRRNIGITLRTNTFG